MLHPDGDDTTASAMFVLMISAGNISAYRERGTCQSVFRAEDVVAVPGLRAALVAAGYPTIE